MKLRYSFVLVAVLAIAGCDLEVPDLNNPSLTEFEENPSQATGYALATGLLIDSRAGISTRAGLVLQLGVLGREAYNLDEADPRPRDELLGGALESGSPFGGAFWAFPYATIRDANILLNGLKELPVATTFPAAEQAGIRGYAKTLQALALLQIVVTHDSTGAVLDTNVDPSEITNSPIVTDVPQLYSFIADLLDDAAAELATAGANTFKFPLSSGFSDIATLDDMPDVSGDDFRAFNRALSARVAVYRQDWQGALDALEESFFLPERELGFGVYHAYSTGSGDAQNGLVASIIFAHPSFATDAQAKVGGEPDDRFTSKIRRLDEPVSREMLTSDLAFTIYPSADSPVAIIRNEELLLIRAEANIGLGGAAVATAAADLNQIRTQSGGLVARDDLSANNILDELLYNRRYSLMFEGGHRWIDARRYGALETLPIDREGDVVNERYPLPQDEKLARGME